MYTNENFPFIQIRLKRWEYKSWLLFSKSVSCSFDGNIFLFVLSEFFEEKNKEGKPLPFGAMVKHDCLLKVSLVSGRRGWGGGGGVALNAWYKRGLFTRLRKILSQRSFFPSLWISLMLYDIYQSRFAAFECQLQCSLSFADEEEWSEQIHHGRGKTCVRWVNQEKNHKHVSFSRSSDQI